MLTQKISWKSGDWYACRGQPVITSRPNLTFLFCFHIYLAQNIFFSTIFASWFVFILLFKHDFFGFQVRSWRRQDQRQARRVDYRRVWCEGVLLRRPRCFTHPNRRTIRPAVHNRPPRFDTSQQLHCRLVEDRGRKENVGGDEGQENVQGRDPCEVHQNGYI